LGVHPAGEVRALSPDGRWAASSGWHSDRVRLWNVGTGQMVHEWVVGEQTSVFFTPDSRALIISRGDEFSFWEVETLQPLRRLRREGTQFPGWVAFSPDGRLMALEMAPGVIHLQELATGRTVARLEDPFGDRATWQGFTPDGGQLVVVASKSSAVHVWDLRAIRSRLEALGLDWDWPAFQPAGAGSPATESVTVEAGDLAPSSQSRAQRVRQAIERGRREVAANPDSAGACNVLAWAYLTAPAALRDVQAAVPLAEKAVRLAGGIPDNRNTLALAYYRTGRYREAVETLRPNLKRHDDWALAYDLYLLAMSYHRLGETVRARDYYDWAVLWTAARPAPSAEAEKAEELAMFRAEAEEVLGIKRGK
ncbi:MAG TPA: CDC27 family protein, partial [Gemmataceae bacterium]|nr:CDC27 family protein [Gemmataceae bacterium]